MNEFYIYCRDEFSKIKELKENSKKSELGYFYILEWDNGVKIGSTKRPVQRIQAFMQTAEKYGNAVLGRVAFSIPHINYKGNEAILHQYFSDFRMNGTELFSIDFDRVISNIPDNLEYEKEIERNHDTVEIFTDIVDRLIASKDIKDSALEAAKIIMQCSEERLPYVLTVLKSGGFDIPDYVIEASKAQKKLIISQDTINVRNEKALLLLFECGEKIGDYKFYKNQKYLCIVNSNFRDFLEQNGYESSDFLLWAKRNGHIRSAKNGKSTISTRQSANNSTVRCIWLKIP